MANEGKKYSAWMTDVFNELDLQKPYVLCNLEENSSSSSFTNIFYTRVSDQLFGHYQSSLGTGVE